MPDSTLLLPHGFRVLDAEGDPVSGAKIKLYEGGTSTPKTMYSDPQLSSSIGSTVYTNSAGIPVSTQGGATTVPVWIGTGLYGILVTDDNDVDIFARRINQKGALDTSTFLTSASTSTLSIPVVTASTDTSITTSHRGKLIKGNTTGGNVALTLAAAATLADGWNAEFTKSAAANALSIVTTGAETINFNGQAHTSIALSQLGEGVAIRCDGTAFYVTGYTPPLRNAVGVIVITDRITAAPSSPTPGSRYLVTASYSTFETHDIIETDAVGGFIEYTPTTDCGWICYVQDEDKFYCFKGTAWVQMGGSGMQAFTASGTYTPTPGMTHCIAIVTGAGGGGGGADSDGSSNVGAGGGGAGGTAIGIYTASQIGASVAVTIGAAGAAGANTGGTGGTGGDTTLGALATGSGGVGGAGVAGTAVFNAAAGGAGGAATGGLLNVPGGMGHTGIAHGGGAGITALISGHGGASFWGGGAREVAITAADTVLAGIAATVYGAGGSGAVNLDTAAGEVGGAGMAGVVLIVEFFG